MRRAGLLALVLVLASLAAALAAAPALAATWTVQSSPNASGAAYSQLFAVSCGSDSSCMAVGSSTNSAGATRALAEDWNGSTWTLEPLGSLAGSKGSTLAAVSCVSSTRCTAVGSWVDHTGRRLTLAERWNGAHWTIQPTANPSPALNVHQLAGVSCTSASSCVAVGNFGVESFAPSFASTFNTLIEHWNGHHWSVQQMSQVSSGTAYTLDAVSCWTASACLAVGGGSSNLPGLPLAWRWNGQHWSKLHPPNHGEFAELLGVSCSGAKSCMAVGHFFLSRDQNAISEQLNGTHWTVRTPPRPADSGGAELTGVSCLSASHCTAVGGAGPADPTGGLGEAWDGLHWTIQPTPGGDGWALQQVSCRPTFCAAVGSHGNFTLAERYS